MEQKAWIEVKSPRFFIWKAIQYIGVFVCLTGPAAGSSGTDSYGAIEINLRPTHPSNRDNRPARIFSDSQKREKRI